MPSTGSRTSQSATQARFLVRAKLFHLSDSSREIISLPSTSETPGCGFQCTVVGLLSAFCLTDVATTNTESVRSANSAGRLGGGGR